MENPKASAGNFYDSHYYENGWNYTETSIFKNFRADEIADKTILDYGCGSGEASKVFAQSGCKAVTGIDIGTANVRYAELICKDFENAQFLVADLNHYEFLPNAYDIIWSDTTIELITKEPREIISDCYFALKPGGTLYLSFTEKTHYNQFVFFVLSCIKKWKLNYLAEAILFYALKLRYRFAGVAIDDTNLRSKLKYLWIPFVRLLTRAEIKKVLVEGGFKIEYIRNRVKADINSLGHLEVKATKI